MKKLYAWFFGLLALLLPAAAFAGVVTPGGGQTDWDLLVYGNGFIVREILTGVTLLMTGGNSGFGTLMLLLATLGFLSLAVSAGFDPGKNLPRMFAYVIVVWMVTYGSTRLTANVVIQDLVVSGAGNATNEYRLTGVPAILVLPAALTTQVGVKFTKQIETFFSTVVGNPFTLSGAGVGQFNLFNRMIEETTQYSLTIPELKKSLSGYVTNCVVPAVALDRLKGLGANDKPLTGVTALTNTVNFVDMLASAKSVAIMTPYFPFRDVSSGKYPAWLPGVPEVAGMSEEQISASSGMGILMSCDSSYRLLEQDLNAYAQDMIKSNTATWAKAGVVTPYEETMAVAMSMVAAPGSTAAGFSRPSGLILQQAMVNTMGGTFRAAAMQTGNNELMQAAALSQAEQQQKSAWVAGFSMFNNMMGYVYTVLQAFIFAITPVVVLALLLPGMGKSIFTNYAQILVWLTMWAPMLAIINFMLTVFGSREMAASLGGGLSIQNSGMVSERAKDMVIAAQFLGTMVPLLTWGIVKGAMAFTEFISSGVGSAFSSQAGASAATGNMSMNNMSMDNASMNKYNTMSSSAVGTQAVQAVMGAGSLNMEAARGGMTATQNGSSVMSQSQASSALNAQIQASRGVSEAISRVSERGESFGTQISKSADMSLSSEERKAYALTAATAISNATGWSMKESLAAVESAQTQVSASGKNMSDFRGQVGVKAAMKMGGALGKIAEVATGAGLTLDGGYSKGQGTATELSAGGGSGKQTNKSKQAEKASYDGKTSFNTGATDSTTKSGAKNNSKTTRASRDEQATLREAAQKAKQNIDSITESLSAMKSTVDSQSFNNGVDNFTANKITEGINQSRIALGEKTAGLNDKLETDRTAIAEQVKALDARVDSRQQGHDNTRAQLEAKAAANTPEGYGGDRTKKVQANQKLVTNAGTTGQAEVTMNSAGIQADALLREQRGANGAVSLTPLNAQEMSAPTSAGTMPPDTAISRMAAAVSPTAGPVVPPSTPVSSKPGAATEGNPQRAGGPVTPPPTRAAVANPPKPPKG